MDAAGDSLQSVTELETNLEEYIAQRQQVQELLLLGNNQEYEDLYNSLDEVIKLTEDLLQEARQAQPSSAAAPPPPGAAAQRAAVPASIPVVSSVTPAPAIPSVLPASVAEQIRSAQHKAAFAGQAPPSWAIGARCEAVWSGDGEWYVGQVTGVSVHGNFVVVFDEGGATEEVDRSNVRPAPERQTVYMGVSAPKRKRVEDEPIVTEMPKWLKIMPEDDQKTREKKKKLAKSYKSKMRFQKLDVEQKERQNSWLNFKKGKGAKKKTGFLTGAKKGSMFSVPEDPNAKVGVIGSGKGTTEYQRPHRHDFAGVGGE